MIKSQTPHVMESLLFQVCVCVYFLDFCPEEFLLNITPSTPVPLATAHPFPQHLFDLLNLLDLLDLWDLLDILLTLDTT
jgi:hypothetical protein